jgi:hypothetical protein
MAATEVATPTLSSLTPTTSAYRTRYSPHQPDMVDGALGGSTLQVTNSGDTAVNIANGGAVVQALRYDLTGGPMVLAVDTNPSVGNRFDIIALTYDASHSPPVYLRTIKGKAGTGLPALTNSTSGVWDFPLAHYEKQQNGSLVNLRDRRKFGDGAGGTVGSDDATGTSGVGWFPPAPVIGQTQRFLPTGNAYTWNGTAWVLNGAGSVITSVQAIDTTSLSTSSTNYQVGSPTLGATIVCPPTGSFWVHLQMRASTAGNDMTAYGSFEVHLTNSAGFQVMSGDLDRACWTADPSVTSAGYRTQLVGFTPGQAYYVGFVYHSGTGDPITVSMRQVILEPVR